jgi:hypothetical protein
MLIINIFILILAFVFLNISAYEVKQSNNIVQNWSGRLILDIKLSQDKCPYKYEPLKLGYTTRVLAGYSETPSKQFSYTANINNFFDIYTVGNQPSGVSNLYHRYIPEIKSVPIYSWRNTVICVMRSYSTNYFDIYSVQPYDRCMSGYIKCPNPLDTLNEFMCVKHLWECGINYLKVIRKEDSYNNSLYTKLDFFDGVKSLLIGRNIPGLSAITEFKIAKGKICANPLEISQNKFQAYKLYETYPYANECATQIDGEQYNPFFKLLDSSTEKSVLTSLGILFLYENLPVYPKLYLSKEDYNLFYSSYIGFQNFCSFYYKDIINFQKNQELGSSHQGGMTGIVVLNFLIISFICIGCLSFSCRDEDEKRSCHTCCSIMIVPMLLSLLVVAWVYFDEYNSVASYKYLYENYVKDNESICLDSFHSGLVKYQNDLLDYYPNFYLIVALISTFMFSFVCVIPCLLRCVKQLLDWDYEDN